MPRASKAVIAAVARKEGVTEESLTPPLLDAIDPDALDALYDSETSNNESSPIVTFRYKGYHVVVNTPKDIEVKESTTDQ